LVPIALAVLLSFALAPLVRVLQSWCFPRSIAVIPIRGSLETLTTLITPLIHPLAYLSDVITKILNGHPNSRIDELLPWAYSKQHLVKDVA
jgi:predicted PurR-regulated permease PerM